jgi:pyrroline-5-carboxylate reductase
LIGKSGRRGHCWLVSGERNSRPPDTGQGYRDPVAHDATATYTLAIIGGGNMGEALLGGLIDSGWAPAERIAVVEISAARRAVLSDRYPGIRVTDQVPACEAALIAVKPGDAPAAVTAAVSGGARRILSIAAGVTVAALEAAAGSGVAVLRSMPNTPALVRAGAAALSAGSHAAEADVVWAESVLSAVGTVVRLPEAQLDAFTGLIGSGPAYVYLVTEALIDAGVLVGLPRATVQALVTQLLVGSAELLRSTGDLPETLRGNVTSPGGTTAAGLRELEQRGVRGAVLAAVEAATARSRELGAPKR